MHLIDFSFPERHTMSINSDFGSKLSSCSRYLVGISADTTKQAPTNLLRIRTPYDPMKPPANGRYQITENGLSFTWDHSCSLQNEHPQQYIFTIRNLATNEVTTAIVNEPKYHFERIKKYIEYEYSVSTLMRNGRNYTERIIPYPLPTPTHLTTEIRDNFTAITFIWDKVNVAEEKYAFVICLHFLNV